jgi:hypothetical protein
MRMEPSTGLELSCVATVLMIVMLLAMWADGPGTACALAREPRTALVLSRQVDREHLATDLAAAGRISARHSRSAPEGEQQGLRFAECEASLVQQIASRHSLERSQLKPIPAVGQ